MRLRTFFADVLPDLKLAQPVDEPRPEHDAQKQGREACEARTEGGVAEDAERAHVPVKLLVEKVVKHRKLRQQSFQGAFHAHAARTLEQHCVAWARRLTDPRA